MITKTHYNVDFWPLQPG